MLIQFLQTIIAVIMLHKMKLAPQVIYLNLVLILEVNISCTQYLSLKTILNKIPILILFSENFKITRFTLVITKIIQKIISVQEVLSWGLMIIQTFIHLQVEGKRIIMFGTLAKKYGATLKEGICTLLQI